MTLKSLILDDLERTMVCHRAVLWLHGKSQ